MALTAGTKLSHYQITDLLGKGGMGEVYRARDSKLGREIAIKVLPSEFERDAERLARFEREARMLAAMMVIVPEGKSEPPRAPARPQINVILNWFEELKSRVPFK